jgi:hypothetical protein
MEYAAVGLAFMGFIVGLMFRLIVLLQIVGLLLLLSIVAAIGYGLQFAETCLTIIAVQVLIQGGYFLGLLALTLFQARRARMLL